MNSRTIIPAAAAAGPALPSIVTALAPYVPPVLIGLGIAAVLASLFDDEKKPSPAAKPAPDELPAGTRDENQSASACSRRPAAFVPPHRDAAGVTAPGLVTSGPTRVAYKAAAQPVTLEDLQSPGLTRPETAKTSDVIAPTRTISVAASVRNGSGQFAQKLTAEKVAAVFANGPLTRNVAVAALIANGASRSRAYEALRVTGPFSDCLAATPDGLLAWTAELN